MNQLREAKQEIVRMVFGFSFTGNGNDGALPQATRYGLIDLSKTNGFGGNQYEGISGFKGIQVRFLLTSPATSSYE